MIEISKVDFDKINEIESWLYNYKSIKAAIENLKLDIESLNEASISAADPGKENSKTNKFSSVVENTIMRREVLEKRKKYMETKMQQLNLALASLNEEEYKVIHHFYIDGKRYYEFSHIIGASERSCKRIKKRGVGKIVVGMFGV